VAKTHAAPSAVSAKILPFRDCLRRSLASERLRSAFYDFFGSSRRIRRTLLI